MARRAVISLVALALLCGQAQAADHAGDSKLDAVLLQRAHRPEGVSRVIVRTTDGRPATLRIRAAGGEPGRHLASLGGQVARISDTALHALAALPDVASVSLDRPVVSTMERTAATVGARWVADQLGLDGRGVGVALIDSGVTAWHDDLDAGRIVHFSDFVGFRATPYDDYGHGTHVAGIIAGDGHDSDGAHRGIAPGAHLVVLKALDGAGGGYISTVIAAVDYAIAHRETYNIRVINLSVSAGVYESYNKDPLTLAARRAVDAGIVVVAAAGNFGRTALGRTQYGGIAAPGNAPWVLTVGATTDKGTPDRTDDEVAPFSSRGPGAIDRASKPDIVAPGVAIESLAEPSSVLFSAHPSARVWGTLDTISQPYLSLSGTSMAAPVVTATVALMLQANPTLTPNAVKAILQFTAESRVGYDHHTQGAGFVNARGAVELARNFAAGESGKAPAAQDADDAARWSRHLVWGSGVVTGGSITPGASAWKVGVVWGSRRTPAGDPVVWGTLCAPEDSACDRPWTTGRRLTPKQGEAAAACEDCDADAWIWAGAAFEHGLVVAGSIADDPGAGGAGGDGPGPPTLPAVRTGWPERAGESLRRTRAAEGGWRFR